MAALDDDTRVERSARGYVAKLSRDWEVWGPNGGYVSSIALRAAGAHSRFSRPASFSVHYLGVADFCEVQLEVTTLRAAKRAESLRVTMTQDGRPILEALVWTVAELEGLEHDSVTAPQAPPPGELPTWSELQPDQKPNFSFWLNFDAKPVDPVLPWPPDKALPPQVSQWFRYAPRATFEDPFVDAARSLILLDTQQWPAACRPHAHATPGYVAPTIDLSVNFHRLRPEEPWLLCVAEAPLAHAGLIGGRASVFAQDGSLLASGGGHLLCRSVPPGSLGAA